MKVLYDHQIYTRQNYGGISRYFYELSKGLYENGNDVTNSVRFSDNIFTLDKRLYNNQSFFLRKEFKGKGKIQAFFNKQKSLKILSSNKFDLFHPTYYNDYFFKALKSKKPFVITFFDLIHEKLGGKFNDLGSEDLSSRKLLLNRADAIIAISNSTKQDIVDIYGINPDRINVTYLGNSLIVPSITNINEAKKDYILYVGNRNSYKNFMFLISTITEILKREKYLFVICAGGGEFTLEENVFFESLNIKHKLVHTFINDQKLVELYTNALFFIFPSLYEGFGIPVLEAFACSCPVLLSNKSSLPEVGGDAAIYFDPESKDDIIDKVEKVLYDIELRTEMSIKGLSQLNNFSWMNTINETLNIYNSVLGR